MYCCVDGCGVVSQHGVTMFQMPIGPTLRRKWLSAIKPSQRLGLDSAVCSKHFAQSDLVYVRGKMRLKPKVVPSLMTENQQPQAEPQCEASSNVDASQNDLKSVKSDRESDSDNEPIINSKNRKRLSSETRRKRRTVRTKSRRTRNKKSESSSDEEEYNYKSDSDSKSDGKDAKSDGKVVKTAGEDAKSDASGVKSKTNDINSDENEDLSDANDGKSNDGKLDANDEKSVMTSDTMVKNGGKSNSPSKNNESMTEDSAEGKNLSSECNILVTPSIEFYCDQEEPALETEAETVPSKHDIEDILTNYQIKQNNIHSRIDPEDVLQTNIVRNNKIEELRQRYLQNQLADERLKYREDRSTLSTELASDRIKTVNQDSDRTKAVSQDSDRTKAVNQDSDRTKAVNQDSDRTKAVNQDSDRTKAVSQDSDRTRKVTKGVDWTKNTTQKRNSAKTKTQSKDTNKTTNQGVEIIGSKDKLIGNQDSNKDYRSTPVFISVDTTQQISSSSDDDQDPPTSRDCVMMLEKVQCDIDPSALMQFNCSDDEMQDTRKPNEPAKSGPISLLTSSDESDVILQEPHIDTVEVSDETDEDEVPLVKLLPKTEIKNKKSPEPKMKKSECIGWKNAYDYFCYDCNYTAKTRTEYTEHKNTHSKVLQICDVCEYTTASRFQYLRHRRKHKDEKRFKCHLCSFKAKHHMSLVYHLKRHNILEAVVEKLVCEICNAYQTNNSKWLKRHKKYCVTERKFKCDKCAYVSKRKSDLRRHITKRHVDDEEYVPPNR